MTRMFTGSEELMLRQLSSVDLHLLFGTAMHDATSNRERRGPCSGRKLGLIRLERYDVRVHVLAILYQRPVAHDCGQVV